MNTENSFSFDPALMEAEGLQGELVYDHKMLWRANLYIDEGKAEDWNNLHPWNDPDNNEWFSADADVPGGQIDLSSYTWMDNQDYSNAVAYSITSHDSPFEFNNKMENQRMLLEYSMQHGQNGFEDEADDFSWSEPYAPGATNSPYFGQDENPQHNWSMYLAEGIQNDLNGIYPYRPAFSSVQFSEEDRDPTNSEIAQSTGVDCTGFLQRSASYDADPYSSLPALTSYDFNSTNIITQRVFPVVIGETGNYPGSRKIAWKITSKAEETAPNVYPGLERLIPGDIIYRPGHIMMIQSIEYENDSRSTTIAKIHIIESTHTNDFNDPDTQADDNIDIAGVTNLRHSSNVVGQWVIGRIINE